MRSCVLVTPASRVCVCENACLALDDAWKGGLSLQQAATAFNTRLARLQLLTCETADSCCARLACSFYLPQKFGAIPSAVNAQRALHGRWFAARQIVADFQVSRFGSLC